MAGVGGLSLVLGVSTAWVVTRYEFPGRRVFEWMLVLPFAVPAYLIAYVYTDFLDYAGPVQGALRDAFGWQTRRDLLVPRDPLHGRRHRSDGRGALPLRLHDGADGLQN